MARKKEGGTKEKYNRYVLGLNNANMLLNYIVFFLYFFADYTNFLQGNRLFAYDDYCYYVNPLDNPKSFTQEFINGECPNL